MEEYEFVEVCNLGLKDIILINQTLHKIEDIILHPNETILVSHGDNIRMHPHSFVKKLKKKVSFIRTCSAEQDFHRACACCGKIVDYHYSILLQNKALNVYVCNKHKLEEE